MCIAVLAPKGHIVPNEKLWRGWSINDDGGGFAYVDENDQLVVKRGYSEYNAFQKDYAAAAAKYSATSPFLVHMRIGSQGDKKGQPNTHPFTFTPKEGPAGCLIHNGTMFAPQGEWVGVDGDKKSDTRVFAERLGEQLCYQDVKDGQALLSKAIGYSRMAFLYANREYVILNERGPGLWDDDIWYSNSCCKVARNSMYDDWTK